jgi:hypothetical protein
MAGDKLTAWGAWVRKQPRGIMTKAQRATGLAYSTVHGAQTRLVREDVALLLSKFTRGEVKAREIELKRRHNDERAA